MANEKMLRKFKQSVQVSDTFAQTLILWNSAAQNSKNVGQEHINSGLLL